MATIWYVDDDLNLTVLTKEALVNNGYDVEIFHDARIAIEEAKKRKPDLILMDMMMPQFSGAEAIKELKKNADLAQIPIVILTGLLSPEEYLDKTRMVVDGKVYRTLCKPYDIVELLKIVKESLRWAYFRR